MQARTSLASKGRHYVSLTPDYIRPGRPRRLCSYAGRDTPARNTGLSTQLRLQSRLSHTLSRINAILPDFDIPDIDGDIRSYQEEAGADFDAEGVALTFHNSEEVAEAFESGCVLVDRSHWGRLRVAGEGSLTFLHNQSTAEFKTLKPGQGCDTVFVSATGRTLDLSTALVMDESVLLLLSPGQAQHMRARLDKYIFPGDNVSVSDISARCAMMSIAGPKADDVMQQLGGDAVKIVGAPYGSHQLLAFKQGAPVIIMVGSGLAQPGYTLIVDESSAGDLYSVLVDKGCVLMGESDWHTWRVISGRPAAGAELSEEVNPLEAALYGAVSVDKGCYIGQETIAKVHNAGPPKQQLWGLRCSAAVAPGSDVLRGQDKVGRVTSAASTHDGQHYALAYVKARKAGEALQLPGLEVQVDGSTATVIEVPFARRSFSSTGPVLSWREVAAIREKEAEAAAKAAAREKKLKEMAERLAAWQATQMGGTP